MMKQSLNNELLLAEAVRQECIRVLKEGYEDAGMDGLCGEGSLEAAISAMEQIELGRVITSLTEPCR